MSAYTSSLYAALQSAHYDIKVKFINDPQIALKYILVLFHYNSQISCVLSLKKCHFNMFENFNMCLSLNCINNSFLITIICLQNKQDLLLMWVVVYTSSMIVGVFFTIGLSCMNSPYLAFLLLGYGKLSKFALVYDKC